MMTLTAVWEPQMTRENTSYPPTVVPQMWAALGACWAPNRPPSS